MKNFKLYAMIFALLPLLNFAQEDDKYVMVETIQIHVKAGADKAFVKAVKAHNEAYHPEDSPYNAWLEAIVTGPNTGTYVWLMGSTTFTELDNRPDGEHDKNVMKHVESVSMIEYWKRMDKLSYRPENYEGGPLDELWFIAVKRGEFYRFEGVLEKVVAVQEKLGQPMGVWSSVFNANDGRDIAISWNRKGWAGFDNDVNFRKAFEEMHGEGSWMKLMNEWEDCTDSIMQEVWADVE